MTVMVRIAGRSHRIRLDEPIDISIPLRFDGPQPNLYDVPAATAEPYEDGQFIGDTRRGGSCNFERYSLIPHCNGTHTECVGHIAYDRISLHRILRQALSPATLLSVEPQQANSTSERYRPALQEQDRIITAGALQRAAAGHDPAYLQALVLRTLPNDAAKKERRYSEEQPPFFSLEAIEWLKQQQVQHLLVDLPSVDRMFDDGQLSVHHLFWEVEPGSHDVDSTQPSLKTITEMIYVPDKVADGAYVLNLQIAPFVADAAPSRPLLFMLD